MQKISAPQCAVPGFLLLLAGAFLLPVPAFAAVRLAEPNLSALSSGLVGYWSMDGNTINWNTGTITDLSGNGNTGALNGMSTTSSPMLGKIGQALLFSGSQWISIAPSSSLEFSGDFSISAWVYYNGNDSDYRTIIDGGSSSWNLSVQSTTGKAMIGETGVADICAGATVLSTGWHFLAGTRAGNTFSIYVDGRLDGTCTSSVSFTTTNTKYIGKASSGSYWLNAIDDVRVYNRALSQQEIQMLYETGSFDLANTPAGNSSFSINQGGLNAGLVAYWPLDGDTTNWATGITKDVSGNGYNGQMTGLSTTSSPVPGKIGQALNFNGSSGYITTGYTIPAQSSATSFTWSVWARLGTNTCCVVLMGFRNGSTWMKLTPTKFEYVSGSGGISNTIPTGSWVFLTIVKSGSSLTYYQNGLVVGTASNASTVVSQTMYLGEDPGYSSDGVLNGSLDDVRVYNRALSQQEVQQLYDAGEVNIGHSNTALTGINAGLVGYWTFDGPTINWATGIEQDSSGSGDNGQLINFSTTTSPTIGKIGQALSFNGTNSYMSVTPFPSNTSPLTVSAWVYPTALSQGSFGSGTGGSIIDENEGGGTAGWNFGIDGTHSDELWFWPSGSNDRRSTGSVSLNQWTFVTAAYDGTNLRFYINGKLDSTQTMSAPQGSATFFKIGAESWITGYWKGKLDDVRVYNRALSSQEVAQLYAAGR